MNIAIATLVLPGFNCLDLILTQFSSFDAAVPMGYTQHSVVGNRNLLKVGEYLLPYFRAASVWECWVGLALGTFCPGYWPFTKLHCQFDLVNGAVAKVGHDFVV